MGDCGPHEREQRPDIPFRRLLRTIPADYWRLWYVGMIVSTVRWLETVVVGVVVYQQTGSAFIVAMITMLRLLPDGPVRRLPRRLRRTVRPAADAGRHGRASYSPRPCCRSSPGWEHARSLAFRRGELHQRLRLGDRQSAPPHHHGRSHGPRSHGDCDGARCGRQQFRRRMVGPTVGGLLLAGIGIEGAFVLSVVLYATAIVARCWCASACRQHPAPAPCWPAPGRASPWF